MLALTPPVGGTLSAHHLHGVVVRRPGAFGHFIAQNQGHNLDDTEGCVMMIRRLFEFGHEKIAFVGNKFLASDIRERGYRNAMENLKLKVPGEYVFRRQNDVELDEYLASMVTGKNKPDAFFCSSDNLAVTVVSTVMKLGLKVPRDVSVAGFGNLSSGKFIIPNITTIDESHGKVAWRVVEKMVDILSKKDSGTLLELIQPTLIVRQSVQ